MSGIRADVDNLTAAMSRIRQDCVTCSQRIDEHTVEPPELREMLQQHLETVKTIIPPLDSLLRRCARLAQRVDQLDR